AAGLGVDGAALAVLRVDPLVGLVDLDDVPVTIDHRVGSVGHGMLLRSSVPIKAQPAQVEGRRRCARRGSAAAMSMPSRSTGATGSPSCSGRAAMVASV